MYRARLSGRRLATAVLALATVTAVTGTLVTAPAAFAAPVAAPLAAPLAVNDTAAVTIHASDEVVSAGTTGFLTSRPAWDGAGGRTFAWTYFADGTTVPLPGDRAFATGSDIAITGAGTTYTLRDMTKPGSSPTSIDLAAALGPDAVLVGAVGSVLFATKPDTHGRLDLYRVTAADGAVHQRKISYGTRNTGYKIVGSGGGEVLILGSADDGGTTAYFSTTYRLSGGGTDDRYEDTEPVDRWTAASTGGITPTHLAWTERRIDPNGASSKTEAVVHDRANHTSTRHDLGWTARVAVAGVIDDWFLYGLPDGINGSRDPLNALAARSVKGTATVKLLDHSTSHATAPDGSVLVRGGTVAEGEGLYRISLDTEGTPVATMVASAGRSTALEWVGHKVPEVLDGDRNPIWTEWTFNRGHVLLDLTFRHVATGRTSHQGHYLPLFSESIPWNGVMDDGLPAANGDYTWEAVAAPSNGIGGPVTASGTTRLARTANPHDFTDNGSADLLARDASGTLWRDDTYDWLDGGGLYAAKRTKIGTGFQAHTLIEGAGDLAGAPAGDFVARDGSGVLWSFLGKGDGTFAPRTRIGGGWNVYDKIAAGSDLTGDGRPDLVATDKAGGLWLYKATGNWATPYAPRTRIGTGWGIYHQITAVGDTVGTPAGDLVARDTSGVLWLFSGKGDGTFLPRVRIGGGWNAFTQLVGMGDADNDGRGDLLAYGAGGTYVYLGTGTESAPFTRISTSLYRGEGTKFNSVS
ncbi:FG-GAP repeat domain-containing protein [Streptomyces tanashiensis]|uniref:FG-GAP repeat domain-containing protein n=1 Tax=Streptomyces tanashiensis TaxID=67367 RepID=UPI0036A7E787